MKIDWKDLGKTLLQIFGAGVGSVVASGSTSHTATIVGAVVTAASTLWAAVESIKSSSSDTTKPPAA